MVMRKAIGVTALSAAAVLAALGGLAAVGRTAPAPRPEPVPATMAADTGAGELLVVVLGGVFETREEAEAASDSMAFGDLQGYYVVPLSQFQGLSGQVDGSSEYGLVSVFRTGEGATEFASFAQALGYPATVLPLRVWSLGGEYAGLGQEADPSGDGPLTRPIPASLP
jgi:hypothetical protein